MIQSSTAVDINHFHLFCGLGGGARGFNRGQARVGNLVARFQCLGGVDVDAAAVRDFSRLAGVPGTCLDMFSREQFISFHGKEPPSGWREAVPADLRRAAGNKRPHILFLSAPCKGFSGLLPETTSRTDKYQALNGLTLRGMWLALEAWGDDPPELIVFENVPRIATRGRVLLDQIVALLRAYGYVVAETTHDCGELAGLAQSRKRFLLVARHAAKVPPFLYEPPKRRLRGVGEVLGKLPVPGPVASLPMHRLPSLQWRTWVRLAFVEAGSDWRSLNRLNVKDGVLADYLLVPEMFRGAYGVNEWDQAAPTVTSKRQPSCGGFSVADPRIDGHHKSVQFGIRRWNEPSGVITSKMMVGGGPHSVADPRLDRVAFNHCYRIVSWAEHSPAVAGSGGPGGGLAVADPRGEVFSNGRGVLRWDEPSGTIAGESLPSNGKFAVADPRTGYGENSHRNKLAVVGWEGRAGTVTGASQVQGGALSVADPRPVAFRDGKKTYTTEGHYGVVPWDEPGSAVTAAGQHDNGRWSVADPRTTEGEAATALPAAADRLLCVIRSLDGTWHRPFTTLELAALQSLVDPEELLELDGLSDQAWRERIGNAVPPESAAAIASVMGRTLLAAWSGQTFMLSAEPIWVQPIAVALSVAQDVP